MVIWVSYYDIELKKRVRGVPQDIFDDPKVRRIVLCMITKCMMAIRRPVFFSIATSELCPSSMAYKGQLIGSASL